VSKLRLIVFDEETSPQKGFFFGGIWETNIVGEITWETIVMISYWDSTTKKVKNIAQWDFPDWRKGVWNDKSVVKHFRKILIDGNYDIIAGQNSDQFDIKLFNARLAFWGFDPLPDYKTFDTKKIAKSKIRLPSYSLDVMAKFFGLGGKYHHSGLDMWFGSRDGNKKDQKEMTKYCNIDILRTKDVLYKLLPFVKWTGDFVNKESITCPNPLCLSKHMIKNKRRIMRGGYKIQYQCQDCGSYWTDPKMVKNEQTVKTTNK
jgi:DNA polymerase elongation subunit (family B)